MKVKTASILMMVQFLKVVFTFKELLTVPRPRECDWVLHEMCWRSSLRPSSICSQIQANVSHQSTFKIAWYSKFQSIVHHATRGFIWNSKLYFFGNLATTCSSTWLEGQATTRSTVDDSSCVSCSNLAGQVPTMLLVTTTIWTKLMLRLHNSSCSKQAFQIAGRPMSYLTKIFNLLLNLVQENSAPSTECVCLLSRATWCSKGNWKQANGQSLEVAVKTMRDELLGTADQVICYIYFSWSLSIRNSWGKPLSWSNWRMPMLSDFWEFAFHRNWWSSKNLCLLVLCKAKWCLLHGVFQRV